MTASLVDYYSSDFLGLLGLISWGLLFQRDMKHQSLESKMVGKGPFVWNTKKEREKDYAFLLGILTEIAVLKTKTALS